MHPTDVDPQETREWLEALDAVVAQRRRRARAASSSSRVVERAPRVGAPRGRSGLNTPYVNTIPPEHEAPLPGRPRARAPHPLAHPLERDRDGAAAPTRSPPSSAATSRATSRRRRSTRSASTTSGTRRPTSTAATSSTSRATRRPASTRARSSRAGSPRSSSTTSARRSTRRRPLVLPAPVADAGLLAVPDRVDGPRPAHGDLPGALHEVPRGPRHRRHRRAARSGRSSATARWTSPSRWARSRWPAASSSTT